jgi:hypothetical protein
VNGQRFNPADGFQPPLICTLGLSRTGPIASMEITKSSRHQKIIGQFGEMIICNWLSRSGFEVTVVDHTGLDIVAFDPITGNRLVAHTRVRLAKLQF